MLLRAGSQASPDSPKPSSCFRPTGPSTERGWARSEGGGLGAPLQSPASRGPVGSPCWTACGRVTVRVRSHCHSMASPVPSPPGSQPGFRRAAGEGGVGASCPRSRRQAAEMHGLMCTEALAALSTVRIQAVRRGQSPTDVSIQCLAQMPRPGTAARASAQGRAAALWAFAVGPPRAAPPTVQRAGAAGRGPPSDPPGSQLWLSPLGLCTCCTQTHPQSQGDKTYVCNPGRRRRHGLGSSGVLAASEGPRRPGAGRRWCHGKRLLVAKTQKELEDPTHANPRARSSLPPAVRSQDSVEFQ